MAEKKAKRDSFVVQRTRVLAAVVLTRRDNLKVSGAPRGNAGLDLLVAIQDRENPGLRQFGVVVREEAPPATEKRLAQILETTLRELPYVEQNAIPVCLLYLTLQGNQGYFTWLVEPVVTEEGAPKLRPLADPALVPLYEKVLTDVVQQVRAWYEALFAALEV